MVIAFCVALLVVHCFIAWLSIRYMVAYWKKDKIKISVADYVLFWIMNSVPIANILFLGLNILNYYWDDTYI